MRREVAFSVVFLAWLGCGYAAGYRLPEGVYRLAVPIFENKTFPLRREVEYDLTRALRQELELRSDARLVPRKRADAVLEGTVLSFTEEVLTEGRLDTVQESSVSMRVGIRLVRTSDGSAIFEREISDSASFSVLRGETVADARQEAINEIAERIVAELESWD